MASVQPIEKTRYGGFDALRILAALLVVLTHSYELTGHIKARPAFDIGNWEVGMGNLGVAIFFVTSGFLVASSWDRVKDGAVFCRNRIARIWPALTVLVLISVLVLGPALTTLSTRAYFTHSLTEKYFIKNELLFFGAVYRLPGVFAHNPTPAVNGSLWTLPYEIWAYVALLVLGAMGLLKRAAFMGLLLVGALVLFRFGVYDKTIPLKYAAFGMTMPLAAGLGSWFLAGVFLSRMRERFDLRLAVWPGVVLLGAAFVTNEPVLFIVGLAATVIGLGVRGSRATTFLHRFGDPSYGVYIWSFPLQQLLYRWGVHESLPMLALSAPLSLVLGYASWTFVEQPALRRFRDKKSRTREVEVQAST